MTLRHSLAFVLALVVWGCTVNPLPDPPNFSPEKITTPTDPTQVRVGLDVFGDVGAVRIDGGARGTGLVWIANLDESDPPELVAINSDGSFRASVPGLSGHELRLQVRDVAGDWADPIDLLSNETNAPLMVAPRPLQECLTLDPPLQLDFGDVAVGDAVELPIRIDNGCGAVTLTTPRLRIGGGAFEIVDSTQEAVTVRFAPTSTGELDDVLFIEVTDPMSDRRPITLRGGGV